MDERAPTLVVVGASAGGVEALTTLVGGLPEDLDAAICVVLHLPAAAESRLADILSRAGPLPAAPGARRRAAHLRPIYVAPPDRHLTVRGSQVLVARGPHENGVRPSIDVLFRSAAVAYGPQAVAVVLSGARDDGVSGASAVGTRGGCVFVQEPTDSLFASLPEHTVSRDYPDRVLPVAELAPAVAAAVRRLSEEVNVSENRDGEMRLETEYATLDAEALARDTPPGESSVFACPACGGVLWELDDAELPRYRCRVGHAYSAEGTVEAQGEAIETASGRRSAPCRNEPSSRSGSPSAWARQVQSRVRLGSRNSHAKRASSQK
jgi:two-component system chemotaxis response regulator CheB